MAPETIEDSLPHYDNQLGDPSLAQEYFAPGWMNSAWFDTYPDTCIDTQDSYDDGQYANTYVEEDGVFIFLFWPKTVFNCLDMIFIQSASQPLA